MTLVTRATHLAPPQREKSIEKKTYACVGNSPWLVILACEKNRKRGKGCFVCEEASVCKSAG